MEEVSTDIVSTRLQVPHATTSRVEEAPEDRQKSNVFNGISSRDLAAEHVVGVRRGAVRLSPVVQLRRSSQRRRVAYIACSTVQNGMALPNVDYK